MFLQKLLPAALPLHGSERIRGLEMVAEGDGEGVGRIQVLGGEFHAEGFLQQTPDSRAAMIAAPWARPSFSTTCAFLP